MQTRKGQGLGIGFCALLMMVGMAGVASGADADGKFAVRGVGGLPCSRLVSYVDSKNAKTRTQAVLAYQSWLNGYLSHVNRSAENTFDASPIVSGRDMLSILLGQCRKQPDALTETIAAGVISTLADARLESESPIVTLSDGDRSVQYRRSAIVAAQRQLIEEGYLKGRADGAFGPATSSAVAAFQKAKGLEENGFLSTNTMIRLLLTK